MERAGRLRQEILHRQAARKQAVHAFFRVAYRHGMPGVAVITRADGGETAAFALPYGVLVLQRHLHRHFHRHRAAVGIKHLVEGRRQQFQQQLREPHRRLVGEPAEHHMAHLRQLCGGRGVEARVVVAVQRRPPRRSAVHQPFAVGQLDAATFRPCHDVHRLGVGHGGVGVPNVAAVDLREGFPIHDEAT